ncbi:hypothetical protein DOTSEDRAFT_71320 [Dothistroma septosporum NZE10]|uniref:Uncharacterized protein n=1 Tax=Dothistroma septosporum (strain NZE10 / CBS 128990) TaxID=675120 RepID=N1PRL4_DOTSN|nr:hypothetical protein DOTSEDRAFT_71320 [Dothistroma septosporum NZE10]
MSVPRTLEEWRTRANKAEEEATDLHNLVADRDTKIAELEEELSTTERALRANTANITTLQTNESQAGTAITAVETELAQAQQQIAQLKEARKQASKDEKTKIEQAQNLTNSAFSDVTALEAKVETLEKERDEAVATSAAHDEFLKLSQERFAQHAIDDPSELLELIIAEVAPVLREQDLDVNPQNILGQFLRSQHANDVDRCESDLSSDQQALHRKDSHHLSNARKVSLHHELADVAPEEVEDHPETAYLFRDTGDELYPAGEEFGETPLTNTSDSHMSVPQQSAPLATEMSSRDYKLEQVEIKHSVLMHAHAELMKKHAQLGLDHASLSKAHGKLIKDNADLTKAHEKLQTEEVGRNEVQAETMKRSGQIARDFRAAKERHAETESTMRTLTANLEAKIKTLEGDVERLEEKNAQTEKKLQDMEKKRDDTQEERDELFQRKATKAQITTADHYMAEIDLLRKDKAEAIEVLKGKDAEIAKVRREVMLLKQQRDHLDFLTNNLSNDKEALAESVEEQKNANRIKFDALNMETVALRKRNTALTKKLDATTATTKHGAITESHPDKASFWQNLTQLPWWMKAIFLLLMSLYACLFFAAYRERKKWLDANDLSWEVTPYDLGRGYSYGTGYNYDYGGGYSTNSFVRWVADDVLKLTRAPYG